MAADRARSIAGALEKVLAQASAPALDDAALLGAFVERRDGVAFAELVRRHGPMVLGVCLRVLRHRQDAEDAFQATFLVLARKADSVSPRNLVGNWLHGVALQTAVRARAEAMKRRGREAATASPPERAAVPEAGWDDVAVVLDEELQRLPDHYRALVLLCDVEGRSRKDAAAQLGCPEGSVSSRLSRARAMLARRLAGRGVTLSAGSLALLLGQNAANAAVPAALLHATAEAVGAVAAGTTLVAAASPAVTALTEGVVKAMLFAKLKTALLTALVLALVGVAGAIGIGAAGGRGQAMSAAPGKHGPAKEVGPADIPDEKIDKRPLTAKELTGKWFGEAENKDGIRKLSATLDFDVLVPDRPEVRCSLRYSTPASSAAQIGIDLAKIDDGTTGRVNLRFETGKVVLGHLARGENGTLLLTMLPEIEKRNMKGELIYRRFEGLVLRRREEPKGQARASERPGDSVPQGGSARPGAGNNPALGVEGKIVSQTKGWSEAVNRLRARLVLVEGGKNNGSQQVVPYLELRTEDGGVKVRCDRRHVTFALVAPDGKERAGTPLPGNGTPTDDAGTVTVPSKSSAKVRMASPGWGIPKDAAAMLTAGNGAWVLEPKDKGKVILRLTLHGENIGNDPDRVPTWHGKIELSVPVTWGEPAEKGAARMLLDTMEGYRKVIPAPKDGMEEHNGPSVPETEPYLLTHLDGVARRLNVTTKAECLVLLPYLEDEDAKLRYIAMRALAGKVNAFPAGASAEAFTDRKSDEHRKMVLRYAELVARLAE